MALLDRFRSQPRQKHPDATVRLAFVQEIPLHERDLLAEIARDDSDPRVRKAAVAKLMDPASLAGVARQDGDETVRTQALAMLRDIALEAFEGIGDSESLAAIDALATLPDVKALAHIAKTAPGEGPALRALARITDVHVLGSVARHAAQESTRRAALDRVQDHGELLDVALNSEFKDTAVAAVERLSGRDDLEKIAARAKNRSGAKRARALIHDMDERAAAEASAAAAALAQTADPDPSAPDRAARERAEREAAAESARAAEAERQRAEEEAAARAQEEHEAAERTRVQEAEDAARQEAERRNGRLAELVLEVEAAAEDHDLSAARRRLDVARRQWKDLSTGTTVDPDLAARFAAAETRVTARDATAKEQEQQTRREALVRIQHLITRVEALSVQPELTLKAGERALRDIRTTLAAVPPLPSKRDFEEAVQRLKAAQAALTPRVQELRDVADWQRWANVGIQEQLCEKMEALKALDDPEAIARQVRELQQQWREAADVPRAQGEALWKRFKAAHDEVWAKCEAHFAEQAGVRAENLAKKLALCERAEALADSTNWIQTADEIKRLQAEWKTIGAVTRGQEKSVWERFRSACDRFFTRRHTDLVQRKAIWAENLAKKEALCVRVEALADSTDWEPAATEIRRLQGEWKAIGPVKKTRSEAIWQRFRSACDHFFSRYAQRHDIARGERVAAREAIVSELEQLSVVSPESAVASPESAVASPESSVASPESAVTSPDAPASGPEAPATSPEPPADLLMKVRDIRRRWQAELAARGVDRDRAAALDDRFAAASQRVMTLFPSVFKGTDLDIDANRARMEAIVKRMEDLANSLSGPASAGAGSDPAISPTTRLAAMLKEALAANTIGGKVDEDSRLRAAAEEVRQAQASFARIGLVPDQTRRMLADRLQRAIRRISERAARSGRSSGSGGSGGSGRSGESGRSGGSGRAGGSGGSADSGRFRGSGRSDTDSQISR
jgi:hypothetical protein